MKILFMSNIVVFSVDKVVEVVLKLMIDINVDFVYLLVGKFIIQVNIDEGMDFWYFFQSLGVVINILVDFLDNEKLW